MISRGAKHKGRELLYASSDLTSETEAPKQKTSLMSVPMLRNWLM